MVYQLDGKSFAVEMEMLDRQMPLSEQLRVRAVPKAGRVDIPLTSALSLRRSADMLRKLANSLDQYSRFSDWSELNILVAVRSEIAAVNRALSSDLRPRKRGTRSSGGE